MFKVHKRSTLNRKDAHNRTIIWNNSYWEGEMVTCDSEGDMEGSQQLSNDHFLVSVM